MEIFNRFRNRLAPDQDGDQEPPGPVEPEMLPQVNQRVTVMRPGIEPAVTRVDDETDDDLILALPGIPMQVGQALQVSWDELGRSITFETTVTAIDLESRRPSVSVAREGRITELREQVGMPGLQPVSWPMSMRIVLARELMAGQVLNTETVAVGPSAVRFSTSAPLHPGDTIEARIFVEGTDAVQLRCRVVRMEPIPGSWRRMCHVTVQQVLRSDRQRLVTALGAVRASPLPVD